MKRPIEPTAALERVREWAALQDMPGSPLIDVADPAANDTLVASDDFWLFAVTWPQPGDAFPSHHFVSVDRATGDIAPLIPPGLPG